MNSDRLKEIIKINSTNYTYYNISTLNGAKKTPYSLKVLLENSIRKDNIEQAERILAYKQFTKDPSEIRFYPARVLMQDFTGVPAIVDLAAMRDRAKDLGIDPRRINPLIPVDLVVDHSVQIDYYGAAGSLEKNVKLEYERNIERYRLLKWAQKSFSNLSVVPPNSGICHQVNLESLGKVIRQEETGGEKVLYPDSVLGTDSHTPMINALSILGWGVGGIEAEAVMLGEPYFMTIPEVIGVRLKGNLPSYATATDLVLKITELLRKKGVVGKFVEYFGEGLQALTIPDRAVISNMTPEYGATAGFFPIDGETIRYLRATGREEYADITEAYAKAQGMFYDPSDKIDYTEVIELDLSTILPAISGPSRPQDYLRIRDSAQSLDKLIPDGEKNKTVDIVFQGEKAELKHGSIAIASITSCTNTSNPVLMLGAGLLAKHAVEKGLSVPSWIKTSLAPGSRVIQGYLENSGLLPYLEKLGFFISAYGCTTCIGNSGPLDPSVEKVSRDIVLASVLSGNRNFEARIHPAVRANYLASPLFVIAYAIAGNIQANLDTDPLGFTSDGKPIYLKDIWPDPDEVQQLVRDYVTHALFKKEYSRIYDGDEFWRNLKVNESLTFAWDNDSTYIRKPPFFENITLETRSINDIRNAYVLVCAGDMVTTDHISPAGSIRKDYPAGLYLQDKGVKPEDFNSYGARRGNHEVMMRGTFGNVRLKNHLVTPEEGSLTLHFPDGKKSYIYDAAMQYQAEKQNVIILAGKEYGAGSSRDWAAKGSALLGVSAVIAVSYERIHRSNLIGMGVLPLQFLNGQSCETLGLTGRETFSIENISMIKPGQIIKVTAGDGGSKKVFETICRLDTDIELEYYKNQGIMSYVLRKMIRTSL